MAGQAAGHTSLMLFLPTFIIIIHRLNDKTEIKYEIKVGNNVKQQCQCQMQEVQHEEYQRRGL